MFTSQRRMDLSSDAEATVLLSDAHATSLIPPVCPSSVLRSVPLSASQIRTVLSEAANSQFGLEQKRVTTCQCSRVFRVRVAEWASVIDNHKSSGASEYESWVRASGQELQ